MRSADTPAIFIDANLVKPVIGFTIEAVQAQGLLFETNEGRNADRWATEQKLMAVLDRAFFSIGA